MWRGISQSYLPNRTQTLVFCLAVLLCVGLLLFRWFAIENHTLGEQCEAGQGPWWCIIRHGIIQTFVRDWFGLGSLIAGIAAFILGSRGLAIVAVLLGAAGLVLYNVNFASLGALVGLIQLARPQKV